ncbi:MAG: YjfB family protein [Desulfotomaculaceae bacterium]
MILRLKNPENHSIIIYQNKKGGWKTDADALNIAGTYSVLKMVQNKGAAQTLVLRKAMDQEKTAMQGVLNTMTPVSNPPNLGNNIDRYV